MHYLSLKQKSNFLSLVRFMLIEKRDRVSRAGRLEMSHCNP